MSSEQRERMAVQYAERSLLFTVKSLLKILEWSRRQALSQDSAYKIGVQKLEELLQSPYSIDTINLKKDFLDKPIDIEKFKADFTMDKSLDDAIDEAKSQITFRQEGAVKQKEMVR